MTYYALDFTIFHHGSGYIFDLYEQINAKTHF